MHLCKQTRPGSKCGESLDSATAPLHTQQQPLCLKHLTGMTLALNTSVVRCRCSSGVGASMLI